MEIYLAETQRMENLSVQFVYLNWERCAATMHNVFWVVRLCETEEVFIFDSKVNERKYIKQRFSDAKFCHLWISIHCKRIGVRKEFQNFTVCMRMLHAYWCWRFTEVYHTAYIHANIGHRRWWNDMIWRYERAIAQIEILSQQRNRSERRRRGRRRRCWWKRRRAINCAVKIEKG